MDQPLVIGIVACVLYAITSSAKKKFRPASVTGVVVIPPPSYVTKGWLFKYWLRGMGIIHVLGVVSLLVTNYFFDHKNYQDGLFELWGTVTPLAYLLAVGLLLKLLIPEPYHDHINNRKSLVRTAGAMLYGLSFVFWFVSPIVANFRDYITLD